jgi:iron complex transport system permease protein
VSVSLINVPAAVPDRAAAEHVVRRRRDRAVLVTAALVLLAALAFVAAICLGPAPIAPLDAIGALLARIGIGEVALGHTESVIVETIRLPRALLGAMIGIILALSGGMMQGLFRNPLADPGLVGVSGGAAFAAALVIVLGGMNIVAMPFGMVVMLPLAAFTGGLLATLLVWRGGRQGGRTSIMLMLLVGIAINALMAAGIGGLVFLANDATLRTLTFWTLGSLGGASWPLVAMVAPFTAILLVAAPVSARALNALMLGEGPAGHLGIAVERAKVLVIVTVALAIGASVAAAGIIGFVGIVVPHMLRLVMGSDNRRLLPASAFGGAALLLFADLAARTVVAPAELPIGILTTALGAPVFLFILLRRRFAGGMP